MSRIWGPLGMWGQDGGIKGWGSWGKMEHSGREMLSLGCSWDTWPTGQTGRVGGRVSRLGVQLRDAAKTTRDSA